SLMWGFLISRLFVIRLFNFVFCILSFLICNLSFLIRNLSFVICLLVGGGFAAKLGITINISP
ncbi:hypothetical protein, partial [Coleofasciculus sp. F4-SAH-05]|uniref:hypothetical protein n=1 Tax=Coleofasciculus sp. F4-SAH-05 TaxID=3069525 RepID=UPI0032F77C5C